MGRPRSTEPARCRVDVKLHPEAYGWLVEASDRERRTLTSVLENALAVYCRRRVTWAQMAAAGAGKEDTSKK
jgi:hypothetical protein